MYRAIFWLWLFLSAAETAQAAQVIAGPTQFVRVLPGQRAQFQLQLRLSGPSDNGRLAFFVPADSGYADYNFGSQDPLCGQPRWEFTAGDENAVLIIELPSGEATTRDCTYSVLRGNSSTRDLLLPFDSSHANRAFFGYVPNVELSQQLFSAEPDGSKIFSLTVRNPNAIALSDVPLHTQCLEYDGGIFASTNHIMVFDFPGACTYAGRAFCLNFTGQNFTGYRFLLNSVAAQTSASCLVKLQPRRAQGVTGSNVSVGRGITLDASVLPWAKGGSVYIQHAGPVVLSTLASVVQVPALTYWSLLILVLVLLAAARRF